jgi:hypothetical protein
MAIVSGQAPLAFAHRQDLRTVPSSASDREIDLHGGFAVDKRPGFGHVFYGMPGCGLVRVDPGLDRQGLIKLPEELTPLNFHSTKIGVFDGKWRLFLPAHDAEMVTIVSLEGRLDFVLPRPEFEAYQAATAPFRPTDTVLMGRELVVADGYGANYITVADVTTRSCPPYDPRKSSASSGPSTSTTRCGTWTTAGSTWCARAGTPATTSCWRESSELPSPGRFRPYLSPRRCQRKRT